jgi:hypothetical protein
MSQCNKLLHQEGVLYPRTCAVCALGPCKNEGLVQHNGTLYTYDEIVLQNKQLKQRIVELEHQLAQYYN